MKWLSALTLLLAGCGFGLDRPVLGHDDDAAVGTDDGGLDSVGATDAALGDGTPDTPVLPAVCPGTYTINVVGGSKYRLVTANKPWDNGQSQCLADQPMNSSRHTHLAVITSDPEIAAVSAVIAGDTYIGLSDRVTEGAYVWVTAESTTYPPASGAPWAVGEPTAGTATNCAIIGGNGTLRVVDCNNSRDFICECDAYAADPTRY